MTSAPHRLSFRVPARISVLAAALVLLFTAAAGEAWREVVALTASDGVAGDGFGASIAASGDRLIIGAPGANEARGAAYVFERGDGGWQEAAKLTAPDGRPGDGLGGAVALAVS